MPKTQAEIYTDEVMVKLLAEMSLTPTYAAIARKVLYDWFDSFDYNETPQEPS